MLKHTVWWFRAKEKKRKEFSYGRCRWVWFCLFYGGHLFVRYYIQWKCFEKKQKITVRFINATLMTLIWSILCVFRKYALMFRCAILARFFFHQFFLLHFLFVFHVFGLWLTCFGMHLNHHIPYSSKKREEKKR